jgi:6 kDa early secretory antigenic target
MADSDYTLANFGSLAAGEADYQQVYSSLVSTIDNLDGQLRAQLSEWEGSARQAYYVAKGQWDQAMAAMQITLQNLQKVAAQANVDYPATEASNTQLWTT